MADKVLVSGFDKAAINGTYTYWKSVDGYDAFVKDASHVIVYQTKFGAYSQTASYYILENKQISGGIPQWVPVARSEGSSISSPAWITMEEIGSNEQTIGTTTYDNESSSSSSVDSSSSSSG